MGRHGEEEPSGFVALNAIVDVWASADKTTRGARGRGGGSLKTRHALDIRDVEVLTGR